MMRLLILMALSAGVMPAEQPAATPPKPPPVRLDGPEVALVSWDSGSVCPADYDGDGRLDAALINNENAKLVLLYQRAPGQAKTAGKRAVSRNRWEPVLEDSRFEKASLPADQRHFAMTCGDFDGDGKTDLALTGATDALLVRFQGKDATFSQTWKWKNFEPLVNAQTITAADLNGDNKPDLAILAKTKLLVFLQKPAGGFGEPVVYATGEEKAGYLNATDADGDGAADLIYHSPSGEGTLRVRRQIAPGAFASEVSLPCPAPASTVRLSRDAQGRLLVTRVHARSRLIERHVLVPAAPDVMAGDMLLPTVYAPPGGVKNGLYAYGDLNGDGLMDLAQADGKAAQVVVYLQKDNGTFHEPKTFPSLNGINALAAIPMGHGQPWALAVASQKEGFGVSRLTGEGRLEFPALQQIKGTPAAAAAVDLKGDGKAALCLLTGDGREWSLSVLTAGDGKTWTGEPKPLKALKRDPAGIESGDLNGDGKPDLLIVTAKEPALILLARADGNGFDEPLAETPAIRSQLADLGPDKVALTDIDGDKRAEILTCGAGYARALRLTPDGKDVIIGDQFNARQPDDKLGTPAFVDLEGDGTSELVFTEGTGAWLQVLQKDANGVYRSARRLESGAGDVIDMIPTRSGKAGTPHLLLAGKERFWTAPLAGARPRLELVTSYETDLKNCQYYAVVPGDLNADGADEIIAFDHARKIMEVLAPAAAAGQPWHSLMHFVLFEENMHFRGRKGQDMVREAFVRDFTGDGRADLLLLVHDRVLLYPQS